MIKIANVQFWVHDQDKALAFYTRKLGWEVRAHVTMGEWDFRWLVVGPAGQDATGLVLMPVPSSPMLEAESSSQLAELVAKGPAAPCSSRPTTARRPTTSFPPAAWSSTTLRPRSPTASTRRSGIPPATTSVSPRCSSSQRTAAEAAAAPCTGTGPVPA